MTEMRPFGRLLVTVKDPMPALVDRVVGALVALIGVALAALGVWFATQLGSAGTATFTATPKPTAPVVIGPDVLNRVDGDVRVTAYGKGSEPVTLAVAAPSDVRALLGKSATGTVTGVEVVGWKLRMSEQPGAAAPAVATADLWRDSASATGSASVTIRQSDAPESVVVSSPAGLDRVELTWTDSTWFVTAVITALVGLALLLGGILLLLRSRKTTMEVQS